MENKRREFEIRQIFKLVELTEELILNGYRNNQNSQGEIVNHERQDMINTAMSMILLAKIFCLRKGSEIEVMGEQDLKDIAHSLHDLTGIMKRKQLGCFHKDQIQELRKTGQKPESQGHFKYKFGLGK